MKVLESNKIKGSIIYKCVGCGLYHVINTDNNTLPVWGFNQNLENPTLSPSVLIKRDDLTCHHFINDGYIEFLNDCTHSLAGQKVEMPEIKPNSTFYKIWESGNF